MIFWLEVLGKPLVDVEILREVCSQTGRRRGASYRFQVEVVWLWLLHRQISEVEAVRTKRIGSHERGE